MTNQSSSLSVHLIDDVTKPARTIAQALQEAEKQTKAVARSMADSGASNRFVANLSKLGLAGKDIDKVATAWRDYAKSAGLAANASSWTKAQSADVLNWERRTMAALRTVEREQARFAKARAAATRQDEGKGGGSHAWSSHGALGFVAGAAGGAASAHSIFHVTERGLEAGAERQHVRVTMQNAGMGADEIGRAETAAIAASRGAPNLSVSEIMELHKEARSAVQHAQEAFELIPDLAKAASVLKGMGVQNANIADIVKGGESLGLMNDPKRFHAYLEGQVKAMNVMGKTITTEQIYEAAKYSKAAGASLSDKFLNLVMPSLIQEMHGSSAGDALAMMSKTLRGGLQHKHLPVEKLNEIGMLEDPSKIRRSKTGQIMGYAGKVVGDHELATDPQAFAKIYNEHMEAHGITELEDKLKFITETLPSTAANAMRILIQQEETLKQHAERYTAAPGLDKAAENQLQDASAAVGNLAKSMNDLGAAVTGPGMATAGQLLSSLAAGVRDLAAAAKDHPMLAMTAGGTAAAGGMLGAGYLSYQLMNGFGLKTSAGLLDSAAVNLSAAAAKLSGGAPGVPEGPGGKPGSPPGSLRGRAGALGLTTVLGTMAAPGQVDPATKTLQFPGGQTPASRFDDWWDRTMPSWVPGHGSKPSAAGGGAGPLAGIKGSADEAKASLESLNMTVAPNVDASALAGAQAAANQLLSTLQQISGAVAGATSAVRGMKVPSLGAIQRGNFKDGGIGGGD